MTKPMAQKEQYLDNSPNARKLLESLRYLGYDNLYAISDLVDNAIDADAKNIWIDIERKESDFCVTIADDGIGMDQASLDQASRLGSETPRSAATDLGRFGMGLTTASLSLGRRLTILTRSNKGSILKNVTDYDLMRAKNQFVKEFFGPAPSEDEDLFAEKTHDADTGTVITIAKCDGFKRRYIGAFERSLTDHLGEVYRQFLRERRTLVVNRTPVDVKDPLWLGDNRTEVFLDETYELKYIDDNLDEVREPVRIRLVILPDHGSTALNKKNGYNVQRSGFYVFRNNRQIAQAQLLGLSSLSRHPDFIRFRGELFVTGRLDEAFGIEFTKRDVKPIQSIRDQLDDLIGPTIKSIRSSLKKKTIKTESEGLDHTSSERLIDSKSSLLLKPAATKEGGAKTDGDGSTTRLGIVKFRIANFGREGPIYAGEQRGRTTYVDMNADHPFYERFVLANRDDREVLNAVDALLFSMAVAELKVFGDEDKQQFVESWKSILSSNLRILLS